MAKLDFKGGGDIESPPGARVSAPLGDSPKPIFEPGYKDREGLVTFVKNPSNAELVALYALTQNEIGASVAPFDVVQSVYSHNQLSFWAIYRSADRKRENPKLAGYWSCLPLNAKGLAALLMGELNPKCPDLHFLAKRNEEPAAIYLWAIVARRLSRLAGSLVAHAMGLDFYERIPMYGSLGTEGGVRSLKALDRSEQAPTARIGTFFQLKTSAEDMAIIRAMSVEGPPSPRRALRPRLETVFAATPNQIAKVFAIRAAVFMAEQSCPYDEEFDGNDYSGTHVLGLVDGEPAAVLRMRYFADFVKLERLAVLPKFRRTLIAKLVVEHAIDLARRKGYRRMYGHAQARLVNFWRKFGFSPMSKNMKLVYSDHEYVEMLGEMAAHHDALTVHSDPYVLVRPEGQWDRPGALDRSAARTASNPH